MEKIVAIIVRKPLIFLTVSLAYLLLVGFLKWRLVPPISALWFLVGGAIGIYFLDIAEVFFHLTPSPFRSIVFCALFVIVSFFIVTSSGSFLASGLVLSLYVTLILWQAGEWQLRGNLDSWYRMIAGPVSGKTQQAGLIVFGAFFLLETILFIR